MRTPAHTPRWSAPEDAVLLEHGARRSAEALAELLSFAGYVQSVPAIRFRLHELALCSAERCPCPATRGSAL